VGGKGLPVFLVAWPAHSDCGGVESVPGLDVLTFSGLDNEINDFLNGFLSTGNDLLDRLLTGFLVNGTENLSVGLGKGF